jgi:Ala-tRNA(Pro) deacylase
MREFLDRYGIEYVTVQHSPAYTAMAVAASAHVPVTEMAKTVMIDVDGEMAMAVLPASSQVDFDLLKDALGAKHVALVHERNFKDRFPDCASGAMPPFGNLYGMPVYVSDALGVDQYIAFSAGSHREVVIMAYSNFERLVSPTVVNFSVETLAL